MIRSFTNRVLQAPWERGGMRRPVRRLHVRPWAQSLESKVNSHRKQEAVFIDGRFCQAANGGMIDVINPATSEVIGAVPDCDAEDYEAAVNSAHVAFGTWKQRPALERGRILRKWGDLMMQHQHELGVVLSEECGKPLQEARGEIAYAASFLSWFAEEAPRVYGDVIPAPSHSTRLITRKQPVGVVAAITPWNFPSAMLTRKLGAALAAGCTVVAKPSEETPFSAIALCQLAEEAGLPAGVFNCVTTSNAKGFGDYVTSSPLVNKITFTGSTRVGKLLMKQAADGVKRVSMELGGNAPFIVFDDADLDRAVEGIIASKFRNAGQTCVCANRIFVQSGVFDEVAGRLSEAMQRNLKLGFSLADPDVTVGPLINSAGVKKVSELVDDAASQGAEVMLGGRARPDMGGSFFEPTVLKGVEPSMKIYHEEIFGPVASLIRFETEQEVVARANSTTAGLAAYFYTNSIARAWRVSEQLDFGMVGVNEPSVSSPLSPFGGVKESGIGREGSKYGVDDYLEIKAVCFGGIL